MPTTFVRIDPRADPRYPLELELRFRVLRQPLGMPRATIGFAGEEDAVHFIALDGGAVVGCVLFDFASGRLRAMAVEPSLQGTGIGARLVVGLEAELKKLAVQTISLHARDTAIGFYEKLGYSIEGEPFTEVGIPHRNMVKKL
jgi:ribosomal protein S18 acetylase RimI-like enzyme